ncbi:FAD-dependent oxidoreductase [Ramlibacter sp. AW1]|uniref:FAD-dependent oxidoreductase n=1 Tax=Ramlibacter aurantiacus TaxID=2801330 RepID=A0A936ZME6_9BURK|nr:NAD(P)/FAD-dependent oxidoreductase [Ramlibacter aurantiacus]MBL0419950.1 FAD-dependent oxidoreductase [Ramlibacter aurantiacus]
MQRRSFLQSSAAMGLLGLGACATTGAIPDKARVVVVGGGYGGATAAKYVRLLSDYKIDVVMIEPEAAFISCPLSNLVLGGSRQIGEMTNPYTQLARRHGVQVVRDSVSRIDTAARRVQLAGGPSIGYDKLVVAPGVDLEMTAIQGLPAAHASGQVLQAWRKAGPETVQLRRQLEAMPDGGVYALTIPEQPYRCPPGPYERACQVAWYFKQAKPRSKVLILDANPDVTSKGALFKRVWAEQYPGLIEYRPQHKVEAVDPREGRIRFEVQEDVKAQVMNVLPPMRAGLIAAQSGLSNLANNRWCGVDYLTFESTAARDVHVLGDAIQIAPGMPKSGHMANNHAKVAAAAIVARLSGWEVNPAPMLTNTCYSFVDDKQVMHVASVHAYDPKDRTFKTVPGSGGLSPGPTELEGVYAWNWARNIWADALA